MNSLEMKTAVSAVLGETLEPSSMGADLAALDALLDGPMDADDLHVPDELLEAASTEVSRIDRQADVLNRVAESASIQSAELPIDAPGQDTPETPPEAIDAAVAETEKPKKGKKPKKAADAAPKEDKPKVERVHYHSHSKSAVLLHRLGGNRDVLNLEVTDFALDAETQAARQEALMADLDKDTAKKVAEKAVMLFTGKTATQEVLKRAFTVLARDGYLSSGDKGNLIQNLLDKPYSTGTARSQGNQIFSLFPLLKITVRDGKGRQVPNPNSTLLASNLALLGLTLKSEA